MTCRLLNVVTALSLLLFAALAGLWAYLFASAMYLPGGEPLWTSELRGKGTS